MKKCVLISVMLLIVSLSGIALCACGERVYDGADLFSQYDFSLENIQEIGFTSGAHPNTPYGNPVLFAVRAGDERLAALAESWRDFTTQARFTVSRTKKRGMYVTGKDQYHACIFKDGTSVAVKYFAAENEQVFLEIDGGYYAVSEADFQILTRAYGLYTDEDIVC